MPIVEKYGSYESQAGDLYLPRQKAQGTICLFHGGFWKMPYDRFQMNDISNDLAALGFVVWNIEYRRIGEAGGGWKGTFDDAVSAINHLDILKSRYPQIDIDRVFVAGHSAGGHLAIWSSANNLAFRPKRFVGLAPVLDLRAAFAAKSGNDSVRQLIGGSPEEFPQRFAAASPIEMLPFCISQTIFQGTEDDDVLKEWNRHYVAEAEKKGQRIEYIEIEDCGHMEFLDPLSKAFEAFRGWLIEQVTNFSGG